MTGERRRDLVPLSETLDAVLARIGAARAPDLARIVADWEALAGEPWATRARPVKLAAGELVVEVDDGATASLLKYQALDLIDRCAAAFGPGVVSTVAIRVASGA